ncbi:RidA family protein [Actinomadura viridis]|uniref:RidA family protein n=1 Tax=Actinomadura viridis TaxID=58110 RepID=UPI003681B30E
MPDPATPDTTGRSDTMHLRNSPELIQPLGHYSHVAIHGGLAYVSGQLPMDRHGTALSDQAFDVQVRQVLDNLDRCLITAGTDRSRLVTVTVYITDIDRWPEFDAIYADWIGRHRPARAVAGASRLHHGAAVEVQAAAALC